MSNRKQARRLGMVHPFLWSHSPYEAEKKTHDLIPPLLTHILDMRRPTVAHLALCHRRLGQLQHHHQLLHLLHLPLRVETRITRKPRGATITPLLQTSSTTTSVIQILLIGKVMDNHQVIRISLTCLPCHYIVITGCRNNLIAKCNNLKKMYKLF